VDISSEKEEKMKNMKLVSFVLVFIFMSISCKVFTPTSPKSSGNTPVIDFITPADPLNVTVTLDESSTASGLISSNGGSLSLTAADGSVYNLEIPAKALDADTLITMTAVKSITGAPLDSGAPVSAVQLEPSGLFFNEMLTLTITPAKEIPIKNQVAFGYEGNGHDYHLAVIDPQSKDIKIKLMQFSGAGVGSASDKAWAANLQIQANNASTRIAQKIGAYIQEKHREAIMGAEGETDNTEFYDTLKSALDQFEDQVVLKERAAAELDCKYARKAAIDLLSVERLRQILGITPMDTNTLFQKLERLKEIIKECPKAYIVSGDSNGVTYSGEICRLDKPFRLSGTFPNGNEKLSFTPSNATSGTVKESGESGGCKNSGEGSYTVTLHEQGAGELQWTDTITSSCPPYSVTNTLTFSVPLIPAPNLSCP
jgi:hypothetical protein